LISTNRVMHLLFASENPSKKIEIQAVLPSHWTISDLHDLQLGVSFEETGETLEENALLKARQLHAMVNLPCISDDSGLEVYALQMEPGVRSARYAGPKKDSTENMKKLLEQLKDKENRCARFRTVIAYIAPDGTPHLFEGLVEGSIALEPRGQNGFGYDPIFIPEGFEQTFAELLPNEKQAFSHRTRAIEKFIEFLKNK